MLDLTPIIGPPEQRACTGLGHLMCPPEHPNGGHGRPPTQHWDPRPGKALCASCAVLDACRAYALGPLGHLDRWNILGGTTANERRMHRRANPTPRPGPSIEVCGQTVELRRPPGRPPSCECGRCPSCARRRRNARLRDRKQATP